MLARGAILTLAVAIAVAGCAINRYVVTPYDELTFIAGRDLNPDANGRPSPIAVKVYQLSSRTTFDNLDFNAAFENASVVLTEELVSNAELVLQPGGRERLTIELDPEARFVAVVAAYRHIDQANWKLVLPVNSNWYYEHDIKLTDNAVREGAEAVESRTAPNEREEEAGQSEGIKDAAQTHDPSTLRTAAE